MKSIYKWPDSEELMTQSVLDYWVYSYGLHFILYGIFVTEINSLSLGRTQRCPSMNAPNSTNGWHTEMLTHQVSFISCVIKKLNRWLLWKQSTDSSGKTRHYDQQTLWPCKRALQKQSHWNRNLIFYLIWSRCRH